MTETGDEPLALAGARAIRVLAPNPGLMTLEGTNTWLLAYPGASRCVVVDPGPDDPDHHDAVAAAAQSRGLVVAGILLSHGHPDHSAGAGTCAARHNVGVRALDPAHRLGAEGLGDGDVVHLDGLDIHVLATPGHSADHLCFVLAEPQAVLTGDHVLGRGTTVVAHPDGNMTDYLASLRRLADAQARYLLPGHGPVITDPSAVIDYYLTHRAEREVQILEAMRAGATTARGIVERVYVDVDRKLWWAAEMSVRAHLDMLVGAGRATQVSDGSVALR